MTRCRSSGTILLQAPLVLSVCGRCMQQSGVKRFVLVSSILVNGAAMGKFLNPEYAILNLLGLTVIAKLQAEKNIRQSGVEYTIIKPGGLKNGALSGNLVLAREDTLFAGSVPRDSAAQVAADSLLYPKASFKVLKTHF